MTMGDQIASLRGMADYVEAGGAEGSPNRKRIAEMSPAERERWAEGARKEAAPIRATAELLDRANREHNGCGMIHTAVSRLGYIAQDKSLEETVRAAIYLAKKGLTWSDVLAINSKSERCDLWWATWGGRE
jgi:hypothetical protein